MDGRYYNRKGKQISTETWSALFSQSDYQIVKQTQVAHLLVSTVWLGIDHRFGEGPPIIFETLVLDGMHDIDGTRYSTEAEALRGHKKFVQNTRNRHLTLDQLAKAARKKKRTNASARTRKRGS